MCSVSVPQPCHIPCLWLQTFQCTGARDRGLCVQEPWPWASLSTALPTAKVQTLAAPGSLWDSLFPALARNSPVSAAEGCRAGLRAFPSCVPQSPQRGLQQHLPASSCSVGAELDRKEQLEKVSLHTGSPLDLQLVCSTWLVPPERTVQRNKSSFVGSKHRNGLQLDAISCLTPTEGNHW